MSPAPVLFVGRGRYRLPLSRWLARKWDAVEEQLDYRILGAAEDGQSELGPSAFDSRHRRPRRLDGLLFYLLLPLRVRSAREFRPDADRRGRPVRRAAALLAGRSSRVRACP